MHARRRSRLRRFVEKVDRAWFLWCGFIPDFERLHYFHWKRSLFTTAGLMRAQLSVIPGVDAKLKKTVKELGGWNKIMHPDFILTKYMYAKLADAGFEKEQVKASRAYLANPARYMKEVLDKQPPP